MIPRRIYIYIYNYPATYFLEMKNEALKGFYLLARRLRLFQGKVRSHCCSITGHNASARTVSSVTGHAHRGALHDLKSL